MKNLIYWYSSEKGHASKVVCPKHDGDMPNQGLIEVNETNEPCDVCGGVGDAV